MGSSSSTSSPSASFCFGGRRRTLVADPARPGDRLRADPWTLQHASMPRRIDVRHLLERFHGGRPGRDRLAAAAVLHREPRLPADRPSAPAAALLPPAARFARGTRRWFRQHEDIIQRTVNLARLHLHRHLGGLRHAARRQSEDLELRRRALFHDHDAHHHRLRRHHARREPAGRLLAVVIMFVGVGLFLRLLQAIFRPDKVRFECPTAGCWRTTPTPCTASIAAACLHIRDEGAV